MHCSKLRLLLALRLSYLRITMPMQSREAQTGGSPHAPRVLCRRGITVGYLDTVDTRVTVGYRATTGITMSQWDAGDTVPPWDAVSLWDTVPQWDEPHHCGIPWDIYPAGQCRIPTSLRSSEEHERSCALIGVRGDAQPETEASATVHSESLCCTTPAPHAPV
jgi:hypothetical protein